MGSQEVWASSEDGLIEYVSVQKSHYPGIKELLRKSFFVHESVSIACDIPGNVGAMEELEALTFAAIDDGVSIVAVEKSTSKVVGGAFNKIQINKSGDTYFEDFGKNCKNNSSKALVQFMIDADGTCDLFKLCKIDCSLEIMFLATLPDFGGKGIGTKLVELSIRLAKDLKNGKNIKKSPEGKVLPIEPVPGFVSAIFTSFKSQAIGRKLNFIIANRMSFDDFKFEGRTFASKLDKNSQFTTIEYFKLL